MTDLTFDEHNRLEWIAGHAGLGGMRVDAVGGLERALITAGYVRREERPVGGWPFVVVLLHVTASGHRALARTGRGTPTDPAPRQGADASARRNRRGPSA